MNNSSLNIDNSIHNLQEKVVEKGGKEKEESQTLIDELKIRKKQEEFLRIRDFLIV